MSIFELLSNACLRSSRLSRSLSGQARCYTTKTTAPGATRLERLNARLPRFLHRYTVPLSKAPLSHVSAFLLLHEITAVVPLFVLAGTFHYAEWLPPVVSEGQWVKDGVSMFGKWFRKRGWLRDDEEQDIQRMGKELDMQPGAVEASNTSSEGVRWVLEFATAYALVKVAMPLRLIFSAWAAPWFARVIVIPTLRGFGTASTWLTGSKAKTVTPTLQKFTNK